MSVMGLANSLMLDFRSLVLPRFVYATSDSFNGADVVDPQIVDRLTELVDRLIRVAAALKGQDAG